MIKEINSKLNKDIRVFSIKLVTKNFNAKNSASSRYYEYLLPLSMLKNDSDKN
jgi:tRNA pseudouridine(38-40) synthase